MLLSCSALKRVNILASARAFRLVCLMAALVSLPAGHAISKITPTPSSLTRFVAGPKNPIAPGSYTGDAACRACHAQTAETFRHTAHRLTSRAADKDSIAGRFSSDGNVLKTARPDVFFRMEEDKGGFFQAATEGRPPNAAVHRERFDLVIGSGRKGQSYLYWSGEQLFQLPVSYWTELGQWVNSPGYRDGTVDFTRRVPPRCLECHATYFHSLAPPPNRYDRHDFILGIACEKCHGPGREHVTRYSSAAHPPGSPTAILNPARLPRGRQIDLCALCHAGPGEPAPAPAFSFSPGDNIDDYLDLEPLDPDAPVDVHGSQVELLEKSKCFQLSKTMTCSTCHDVHRVQRDAATFSDRCLGCHAIQNCGLYRKQGQQLAGRCVDCHMPNQPTRLIISSWNGRTVAPRVRNHWIKVYPEAPAKGRAP